ncbi:hypothetical protein llap_14337 [Limosa lapponica baueri]|uniref:Uncharacterized protein n=1 Tax=Limosa lapponica baueri TaxID=1758121 RepID=A0A2I0TNG0_LIMLA|nr:hypothetical protein llap_14337 [Limosa lapponica baueri]
MRFLPKSLPYLFVRFCLDKVAHQEKNSVSSDVASSLVKRKFSNYTIINIQLNIFGGKKKGEERRGEERRGEERRGEERRGEERRGEERRGEERRGEERRGEERSIFQLEGTYNDHLIQLQLHI